MLRPANFVLYASIMWTSYVLAYYDSNECSKCLKSYNEIDNCVKIQDLKNDINSKIEGMKVDMLIFCILVVIYIVGFSIVGCYNLKDSSSRRTAAPRLPVSRMRTTREQIPQHEVPPPAYGQLVF